MNEESKLYEIVKNRLNELGRCYHTLRTPSGLTIEGRYDMEKYLSSYGIPNNLEGKTVLDIGPANGYFAFEMEKRGAIVTAIDSLDVFWLDELKKLMHSNVNFVFKDIETLDESFGKFDLVFCSQMLQHNPDIYRNFERIYKVTGGTAIICIEIMDNPNMRELPLLKFVGRVQHTKGKSAGTFWKPNMKGLIEMAKAAGFKKVEEYSTYWLEPKNLEIKSLSAVIHCSS